MSTKRSAVAYELKHNSLFKARVIKNKKREQAKKSCRGTSRVNKAVKND